MNVSVSEGLIAYKYFLGMGSIKKTYKSKFNLTWHYGGNVRVEGEVEIVLSSENCSTMMDWPCEMQKEKHK